MPWPRLKMWPGRPFGGAKDLLDAQFDNFKRRKKRDGIEISLHRVVMAHGAPAFIERLPPVEANHVRAGCAICANKPAVSTPK